jgi:hypothetical protein
MRQYMTERYTERRAEAIQILGGKCAVARCVNTDFQIDHVDWRKKTMSVDRMAWVGKARFLAELTVCQLLCTAHHTEKSRADISEIRAEETRTGLRRDGKVANRVIVEWPPYADLLAMIEISSVRQVARKLGCSHATVLAHLKKNAIKALR